MRKKITVERSRTARDKVAAKGGGLSRVFQSKRGTGKGKDSSLTSAPQRKRKTRIGTGTGAGIGTGITRAAGRMGTAVRRSLWPDSAPHRLPPLPKGQALPPLLGLLQPFRRRIRLIRVVQAAVNGLLAGFLPALALLLAARILPLAGYPLWAGAALFAVAAASVFLALMRPVRFEAAAEAVDRATGDNRTATALHYLDSSQPIVLLQRQETEKSALTAGSRSSELVPLPAMRGKWTALAGLAALLAVLLLLPNPQDTVLAKRATERHLVKEKTAEVAKLQEELAQNKLPEAAKKPLADELARLEKELKNTHTAPLALAEMEKTLNEMKQQMDAAARLEAPTRQMAEAMQNHPALQKIGEGLRQMAGEQLAKAGEDLQQQVLKMTPEQKAE